MLRVPDGFDDEAVVAGEVEEGAGLAGGAELAEDVFRGEGEEVVGRVELEGVFAEVAEDPWRVVFKLEVVLCGGSQLISDTVNINQRQGSESSHGKMLPTCRKRTCAVQQSLHQSRVS